MPANLCAYLSGTTSPFQRTSAPSGAGVPALDTAPTPAQVLTSENIALLKAVYQAYIQNVPYSTDFVYLCTVKRTRRGTGSPWGYVDGQGRYVPDRVYAVINPESWKAGIDAGFPLGFTSQEYYEYLAAQPDTEPSRITTGENRPDWQYYPTSEGATNAHRVQVIVHRDRDDVPDTV